MSLKSMIPWNRAERNLPVRRSDETSIAAIHQEMNRLFADFFGGWDMDPVVWETEAERWARVGWVEKDKEFIVTAELPGVDEKDIDISLTRDTLTLRGVKNSETDKMEGDVARHERRMGSFHRTLNLGVEVDADKVSAVYKNGVLRITLPKKESARKETRRIEVKAA